MRRVRGEAVYSFKQKTAYEIGGLRPDGFDVGNMTIEKLFDKEYILFDVG